MAKTNPEAPMIKQGKWKYTWHMMKTNKACYAMLLPFMSLFIIFTVVPVVMSLPMGFTNFNMIETPKFVGLSNFYTLFLNDDVFLIAVRNTLIFAIFTGPFSYILSFIIAWLINEMNAFLKTFFTFVFYAPSMTTSVYVTWQLILSGDSYGYLNAVLIDLGILNEPAQWLTDTNYILTVVIIVQLWMSMVQASLLSVQASRTLISQCTKQVLSRVSRTDGRSFSTSLSLQWDHSFCSLPLFRSQHHSQSALLVRTS